MRASSLPPVLLVEDSPADVELARRALAKCHLPNPIVVAERGEDALDLLLRQDAEAMRPALVLLDLNIPGLGGREVLRTIKSDPTTRSIPVVVLSTSVHRNDLSHCYELGANAYHCKSVELNEYQDTIREISRYWLGAVVAPPHPHLTERVPVGSGSGRRP